MQNDPNEAARQAAFYTQQRLNAEKQAETTGQASPELAKIAQKLEQGNAAHRTLGETDATIARGSKANAGAAPEQVQNDPMTMLPDALGAGGAVLREILTHPAAAARVAEHVADAIGPRIGKALAKGFFPDGAEEGAARSGARVVGKAKVEDVPGARRALPAKSSAQEAKGPIRRAGEARIKRQNAVIKGAKAAKGSRSTEPIVARAAKPSRAETAAAKARKAASGEANESKVMTRAKANNPKSPRAKGTNPRAKAKSTSEGVQKGTNPRAEGRNPRVKKASSPTTSNVGHNLADLGKTNKAAVSDLRGFAREIRSSKTRGRAVAQGDGHVKGAADSAGRPYNMQDVKDAVKLLKSHGIHVSNDQAENFLSEAVQQ